MLSANTPHQAIWPGSAVRVLGPAGPRDTARTSILVGAGAGQVLRLPVPCHPQWLVHVDLSDQGSFLRNGSPY